MNALRAHLDGGHSYGVLVQQLGLAILDHEFSSGNNWRNALGHFGLGSKGVQIEWEPQGLRALLDILGVPEEKWNAGGVSHTDEARMQRMALAWLAKELKESSQSAREERTGVAAGAHLCDYCNQSSDARPCAESPTLARLVLPACARHSHQPWCVVQVLHVRYYGDGVIGAAQTRAQTSSPLLLRRAVRGVGQDPVQRAGAAPEPVQVRKVGGVSGV